MVVQTVFGVGAELRQEALRSHRTDLSDRETDRTWTSIHTAERTAYFL